MKECLSSAEGVIRKSGEEFDTGSAPEVASWTDPEDTHLYKCFLRLLSSRKLWARPAFTTITRNSYTFTESFSDVTKEKNIKAHR